MKGEIEREKMYFKHRFMLSMTGIAILSAFSISWGYLSGASQADQQSEQKPKVRKIPVESIYSTTPQEGQHLQRVRLDRSQPYYEDLHRWLRVRDWGPPGASNVILVRGKDFPTAVKAAYKVFCCALGADEPGHDCEPRPIGAKPEPIWLVAYLGIAGSEPPLWLIDSVEQEGKTIRLNYWAQSAGGRSKDLHEYLIWVPLGTLEEGTYSLELFNVNRRLATLIRRVMVTEQ
jgi:hypothetical protein